MKDDQEKKISKKEVPIPSKKGYVPSNPNPPKPGCVPINPNPPKPSKKP